MLSKEEYQKLKESADHIHYLGNSLSLLLKDSYVIKHMYRRGLWSSSTIKSYASRFIANSKRLYKKNILTPIVDHKYYYPELNCDLLIYKYLQGQTIIGLPNNEQTYALSLLPAFVAELHNKKICFRDLHLENIIYQNSNFALIDIASVRMFLFPLQIKRRAKNLTHMFKRHNTFWTKNRIIDFCNEYILAAGLKKKKTRLFLMLINKYMHINT